MTEGQKPAGVKQSWLAASNQVAGTALRGFKNAAYEAFNTGVPSIAIGSLNIVMGAGLHDPLMTAGGAGLVALGGGRAMRYARNHQGDGLRRGPGG